MTASFSSISDDISFSLWLPFLFVVVDVAFLDEVLGCVEYFHGAFGGDGAGRRRRRLRTHMRHTLRFLRRSDGGFGGRCR